MSPLLLRRLGYIGGLLVACAITWMADSVLRTSLRGAAYYSGAILLAAVLLLTLFNSRKKLPFLPLLKASTWLQIHIYAGYFSCLLFLLHIHFSQPRGALNITLAIVFGVVVLSGFFGIYISRILPARITLSGEPLIYERIPAYRHEIQGKVEELIRKAEAEAQSSTLADFYLSELRPFLQRLPGALDAFGGIERRTDRLLKKLTSLNRYMNDAEKLIAAEIRDWIETAQNVHFQYAAQRLLKLWLFVHIPFTYSLVLLALVHSAVALLYGGRG